MRYYDNQTDGLRSVLRYWSRGCVAWVAFPIDRWKLDVLDEKWSERFGTRLPAHVRHVRRTRGQPNAYALAHRYAGAPEIRAWVWLIRTDGDLGPEGSEWRREQWTTSPPQIGTEDQRLKVTREPRPRGDWAWTWKLGDRHRKLIGTHWRALAEQGDADGLRAAIEAAARGLPMFGGVRRQLLAEIELQRRRWQHLHPARPFPQVELPRMGAFRCPPADAAANQGADVAA
jgi:hypothetical protein